MNIIINSIRCFVRFFRLLLQFIIGLSKSSLLRIKYGPSWYFTECGSKSIQLWMQQTSVIIGLKINVSGEIIPKSASLIVANHISWLDIVALSSTIKSTFISKSELQHWPILGILACKSGTLFIKRNNRKELNQAISSVTNILQKGRSVILFPEGTTTSGHSVKKFKSAFFQSAINSNCNIQPITIQYSRNNKRDTLAPYIDNNNFVIHLLRIMSQSNTIVCLRINKQIKPNKKNRYMLTHKSQQTIETALNI